MKKILYVDMDNVLVDFQSGIDRISAEERERHRDDLDEVPGIFALMEPREGALEAYRELSQVFDTYILSTAPWKNATAWGHKLQWVQRHLGDVAHKRLILSHHKHLNRGDYLVDDRTANGADRFDGEFLRFGQEPFADWPAVVDYLRARA